MNQLHLTTLLSLIVLINCDDEQYQNSSMICNRCDCNYNNFNTFYMNCSDRDITNTLANWPKLNDTIKLFVVSFSHNNHINRLKRMPGLDVQFKLTYDHCNIKEIESDLFESCSNIVYLDLSYNELESDDIHADIFKGQYKNNDGRSPINLEELNLSYNKIHSLRMDVFEHLPKLSVLNLAGNDFKVIDIHTAGSIASIKLLSSLNLSDNELTDLPPRTIENLQNLNVIDLSNNDLDFVPSSLKYIANNIKKLYLDNNPIINLDQSFVGMDNLEELTLNNLTKLRVIRTNTFNPLRNLRRIELKDNTVTEEIQDEAFGEVKTLEELHMSNNNLTNLPKKLIYWPHLKMLDINKNPFICSCNLYEIVLNVTNGILKDKSGLFCTHPRTLQQELIYNLHKDICAEDILTDLKYSKYPKDYASFKIMKMSIVMLILVLIVLSSFGIWLAYTKWMKMKRNNNYPFVSQIVYNPLNTYNT